MASCVGYMVGLTSTGLSDCQQLAGGAPPTASCIAQIIAGQGESDAGKSACLQAALQQPDANLQDCFMGLSGQSFYGRTSCRAYYYAH